MTNRTTNAELCWQTDKLALAAYLIANGFTSLVRAYVVDSSGRVRFALSSEPTPKQLADFFNGTGKVSALDYDNVCTSLKAAIFEARRSSER